MGWRDRRQADDDDSLEVLAVDDHVPNDVADGARRRVAMPGRLGAVPLVAVLVVLALLALVGTMLATTRSTSHSSTTSRSQGNVPNPDLDPPDSSALDRARWIAQWHTTPGSTRVACVGVSGRTDVRSGQFIAGNFGSFIHAWDGTALTSRLYYVPLHPRTGTPLVLTARRIEPVATTGRSTTREIVHLHFGDGFAWGEYGQAFYVTGTVLPHAGRWQLQATAGSDRGCFDIELQHNGS